MPTDSSKQPQQTSMISPERMYLFSDYLNLAIVAAIMSYIFLFNHHIPDLEQQSESFSPKMLKLIGVLLLLARGACFMVSTLLVRWMMPRYQHDQIIKLGWKSTLPLSIINAIMLGAVILYYLIK